MLLANNLYGKGTLDMHFLFIFCIREEITRPDRELMPSNNMSRMTWVLFVGLLWIYPVCE